MSTTICPHTGKRRYRKVKDASKALRTARENAEPGDKIPIRSYPCKGCGGHHLTSKPAARSSLDLIPKMDPPRRGQRKRKRH